jgi:hypothetical protein
MAELETFEDDELLVSDDLMPSEAGSAGLL